MSQYEAKNLANNSSERQKEHLRLITSERLNYFTSQRHKVYLDIYDDQEMGVGAQKVKTG